MASNGSYAPAHVEPGSPAGDAQVRVALSRDPATTVVIIDRVPAPQDRGWLDLPPGVHTLEIALAGRAGDTGLAILEHNGRQIAACTVRIEPGQTQAYSAAVTFEV